MKATVSYAHNAMNSCPSADTTRLLTKERAYGSSTVCIHALPTLPLATTAEDLSTPAVPMPQVVPPQVVPSLAAAAAAVAAADRPAAPGRTAAGRTAAGCTAAGRTAVAEA
jgi:hypothetical protein